MGVFFSLHDTFLFTAVACAGLLLLFIYSLFIYLFVYIYIYFFFFFFGGGGGGARLTPLHDFFVLAFFVYFFSFFFAEAGGGGFSSAAIFHNLDAPHNLNAWNRLQTNINFITLHTLLLYPNKNINGLLFHL